MLDIAFILLIKIPLIFIFEVCFIILLLNILDRLLLLGKNEYSLEGDIRYNIIFFTLLFVPIYNIYVLYDINKSIIKLIIKTIKNGTSN
ncbi:hypothetical protein [Rudgehvirus jaberico]|jgi:hypothetical protein|uniref:Transmembrane protein n=1 Tax=Caudoviricetes sp. 'Rudgehvirus jaberico' TaxID=3028515 RepID=A0AAF0D568_9CAUD|nr:hypothetical protein [Caudoviricetes sp. 'Rudgehvirus jaberico']